MCAAFPGESICSINMEITPGDLVEAAILPLTRITSQIEELADTSWMVEAVNARDPCIAGAVQCSSKIKGAPLAKFQANQQLTALRTCSEASQSSLTTPIFFSISE